MASVSPQLFAKGYLPTRRKLPKAAQCPAASLLRSASSRPEPNRAPDHRETPHDIRRHADDQGPLADADSVDEVDDLSAEEEEIGQDGDVVGALPLPDPQGLRNVGGTSGDTD